ncbi:Cytosolic sulfotransferase 1 [Cardamine amara subsp. amara]|uniref:Sulfotransferase n=1 Tax=Cardamine amara subsp. amara TaxID=228776 RepID=A0ABD0YZ78_CARAN
MDLIELPPNVKGDKISEETKILISSLPSDADGQGKKLCKYQGCWYYHNTLQGVLNFQRGFQPQETDIILASFPKSGTTWLKALAVALLERSKNRSSDDHHPLLSDNPHGIVPFLEIDMYIESSSPDLTKFSSLPRLFSTHMPLHTMQETLKNSPCKIVYICRNMKDTLISWWFFVCAIHKIELKRSILDSIYESFCSGAIYYGPFWDHVLSYWRGSLEDPKHVLFMRYEEMKAEPHDQIKRLADFLECPFTKEEEESGLVEEVLELCSLSNLKSLEVNKTEKVNNVEHKNYFRKGEVGDWKNYLTPEMEKKIDMIVQEKLQGSNLKF